MVNAELATIWTVGTVGSMTLMIVLGVLMIAAGLWNVAVPKLASMEWIEAVLGALLFISPWVAQYTMNMGAAWSSWICGGVGVVMGLWALAPAMKMRHSTHGDAQVAH